MRYFHAQNYKRSRTDADCYARLFRSGLNRAHPRQVPDHVMIAYPERFQTDFRGLRYLLFRGHVAIGLNCVGVHVG